MARSFLLSSASALAALLLNTTVTQAQAPKVDIGLFPSGSTQLEVRVRPTVDMDGIFSAVVFTIRWEGGSNSQLGQMKQNGAVATYMPVARSGDTRAEGAYNYQVYAGFGFDAVSATGEAWEAGKEYVIATIPVTGPGQYELVNDAWTGVKTNNGDFYASVNGEDRTGIIYKGLASITEMPPFSLSPNPNNGQFQLVVPMGEDENTVIDIVNAAGQVVYEDRTPAAKDGAYRRVIDLTGNGAGSYNLRITRDGATESHKFVIVN